MTKKIGLGQGGEGVWDFVSLHKGVQYLKVLTSYYNVGITDYDHV